MSEPRIRFSNLRRMLFDLGFQQVPVRKPFIGFQHDGSDTWIVLPQYRGNALVAVHHLLQVRIMLDAKGLMEAEDFDRLVADVPAPHSASR
jgi:hypothetical protein